MAVNFFTNNARGLLDAFEAAMLEQPHRPGAIDTWRIHTFQGAAYYTHTSQQYGGRAFFKAAVTNDRLVFLIVNAQNISLTRDIYAYYAGHLIETFIRHFPQGFTQVQATPSAAVGDVAIAA